MILLFILYGVIIFTHSILCNYNILPGDFSIFKIIYSILLFIFVSGSLFSYLGLKKGPENFNMRFLIVSTYQMLSMLSVSAALIYKKINDVQSVVFTGIALFVILLAVQSFFLIKKVNSK